MRNEPGAAGKRAPSDPTLIDVLALGAITVASALPYLSQLGFYSDDWGILAGFEAAERHGSITAVVASDFVGRPVQGLYLALLFKSFGLAPLGYHIVNSAVLAAAIGLLYLLLLRLRLGRLESFATALLFVMLPQLSTVRVWYAAFQVPLSMTLMLVSMHCQLSFARRGRSVWLAAAVVAAILSIGAYEIFAPLIAGFAAGLAFKRWRVSGRARHPRVLARIVLATVLAAVLYKLAFSGRSGSVGDPSRYLRGLHQLVRLDYDWRVDSSLNIIATPRAHFWAPVEGAWAGAKTLIGGAAGVPVTLAAILILAIAWWRLSFPQQPGEPKPPTRLLLIGIAAFLLGNATFLIVPAVVFTSTGIGNRVHVAAAIGVAMIFVSLIAFAARAFPKQHRQALFSIAMVAISTAAFARMSGIENYWAEAPALQERVLDAARADLRELPVNSTVIVDGVCPYHGPAIVFEAPWDVGGAFTLALGREVRGDVVSPRMSLTPSGLATSIYKQPSFYPYGSGLYIYNPAKHLLLRLGDAAAASRYFDTRSPGNCPVGYVARGVEV